MGVYLSTHEGGKGVQSNVVWQGSTEVTGSSEHCTRCLAVIEQKKHIISHREIHGVVVQVDKFRDTNSSKMRAIHRSPYLSGASSLTSECWSWVSLAIRCYLGATLEGSMVCSWTGFSGLNIWYLASEIPACPLASLWACFSFPCMTYSSELVQTGTNCWMPSWSFKIKPLHQLVWY